MERRLANSRDVSSAMVVECDRDDHTDRACHWRSESASACPSGLAALVADSGSQLSYADE